MEGYYIIKLDASIIIDHMKTVKDRSGKVTCKFSVNLSDPFIYSDYVKSREIHSCFAAAYQIILTVSDGTLNQADLYDPEAIENYLIEMDFSRSFYSAEIKKESPVYKLLECGVDIILPGRTDPVHFVAYDKSNSMARNRRIYYIDETIKDKLDPRLMLDITGVDMPLSKLYSYRGLYYSDAQRINGLDLNEETVVVIADDSHTPVKKADPDDPLSEDMPITVFSNEGMDKFGEYELTSSLDPFDGAGLISPDYADTINKEIHGKANSFQIRLPFAKGMLHKADWQTLIRNMIFDKDIFAENRDEGTRYDNLMIKDFAGNLRNLSKIKILMPVSMFKCNKWLLNYCSKNNIDDCMKYYFSKLKEYDHAMYVSGSDESIIGGSDALLNYQLINPMKMEKSVFAGLIQNHVRETERLRPENICSLGELCGNDTDKTSCSLPPLLDYFMDDELDEDESADERTDEIDDETEPEIETADSFWLKAVRNNPRLVYDPYIEDRLNNERKDLARGMVRGRIFVESERRYLCPDLAAFVIFAVKQLEGYNDLIDSVKFKEKWMKKTISINSIYVPGMKHSGAKRAALFRNPHLSRNEECLAALYTPSMKKGIYRFFRHLTGVAMVGRESLIAMTLGGADFDGDEVKIVTNDKIVNSVKNGLYGEGDYDLSERKVPLLSINGETATDGVVTDHMDPKVICQTFTGSVGMISNKAIRIGFREYAGSEETREQYKDGCAVCSILAGLDIDAAKTGKKPDLSILSDKYKISKNEIKNDYLVQKDELSKKNCGISRAGDKYIVKVAKKKKFEIPVPEKNNDTAYSNNELLPLAYAEYFVNNTELEKANAKERKELISDIDIIDLVFGMHEKGWRDKLKQEHPEKVNALRKVISNYLEAKTMAQKILKAYRSPEDDTLKNKIYRLLELRYDSYEQVLDTDNHGEIIKLTVEQALKNALANIRLTLDTLTKADECLNRINEEKWIFTPAAKRIDKLCRIMDFDGNISFRENALPGTFELLADFNCQNYALLELIVLLVKTELFYHSDEEKPLGYYELKDNMFLDVYEDCMRTKVLKKDFDKRIKEICREKIAEIFGCMDDDLSCAVRFAIAFREKGKPGRKKKDDMSIDRNGEFMWTVFEQKEIENAIEG